MFLTAVLQAHTDPSSQPLPLADDVHVGTPDSPNKDATGISERLKASLAKPVKERLQVLPNAHRARWV